MAKTTTLQRMVFGTGWALNAVFFLAVAVAYAVAGYKRGDAFISVLSFFPTLACFLCLVAALKSWRKR